MARLLAALSVLVLVVVGCGGDDDSDGGREATTEVEIPTGLSGVESVGGPVELPRAVEKRVTAGVKAYVERGVVPTLRTGEPEKLEGVFDPATLASLGTDMGAQLLDRGAPRATGDIRAVSQPLVLVGLADSAGVIPLVAAHLELEVVAETEDGELTITRVGDLTFAPHEDGSWKITAYRALVARSGAGVPTETTEAKSG